MCESPREATEILSFSQNLKNGDVGKTVDIQWGTKPRGREGCGKFWRRMNPQPLIVLPKESL